MKHPIALLATLTCLLASAQVVAQPPALIHYQGRLVDGTNLVNGAVNMDFRLWSSAIGGALLYTDSKAVMVVDGLYHTDIVDDPFSPGKLDTALTNAAVWLEVVVEGSPLTPRERLASVPYARQVHGVQIRTNHTIVLNYPAGSNSVHPFVAAAVISGGRFNEAASLTTASVIAGGESNRVVTPGLYGVIGGGQNNLVSGPYGAVVGGQDNEASDYAFAAGRRAKATHQGAFVWGDSTNADVFSGAPNQVVFRAVGGFRVLGGAISGDASGLSNFPSSVLHNTAVSSGALSFFPGNNATGSFSNISGGSAQMAAGDWSAIGGGRANEIESLSPYAVIAGGRANSVFTETPYAAILGGHFNSVSNWYSVVVGGYSNRAMGEYSFVGGGDQNVAWGSKSVISGGSQNYAGGGEHASISGGTYNRAGGFAAVGGGLANWATNTYSMIPGGHFNTAAGTYSFAAGRRAIANHQGAFVWGDSTNLDIDSTAADQVTFRASGGFRVLGNLGVNTEPAYAMHVRGNNPSLMIENTANTPAFLRFKRAADGTNDCYIGIGSAGALNFRVNNADRMIIQTNGFVGIGTANPTNRLHVAGNVQATAFITSSDRDAKFNVQPVSAQEILNKVVDLPIATWSFRDLPGHTHIGPMAQDFHAAFGFGNTDTGITTVDADGVAFAAIQALAIRNKRLEQQNEQLRAELDAIKQHLGLQ